MDTVEFWLIKVMDMDWPRVDVLERFDTYDEANKMLESIDAAKREHLVVVAVTPIKRGTDA